MINVKKVRLISEIYLSKNRKIDTLAYNAEFAPKVGVYYYVTLFLVHGGTDNRKRS